MSHLSRALILLAALAVAPRAFAESDWKAVDQTFGIEGVVQPDGAHRYNMPRRDLTVKLDGVQLKASFALGSWLVFLPTADGVMVMGDLVLTGTEVNPVMKKLESSGVQITALHNHLLRAAPATMYMHVSAHGDATQLAKAFRAALAESKTPFAPVRPMAVSAPSGVVLADLEEALRAKGKDNNGVYQFSFPRAETLHDGGMILSSSMGAGTAINFQPTDGGKAAITGDFVMIASEVNLVIDALQKGGIEITALHNHMLNDEPRLLFMHFWANDDATKLAKGLRGALDKMNLAGK